MTELNRILQSYREKQKLIAMENGPLPALSRQGLLCAINQAKAELPGVEKQFNAAAAKDAVVMLYDWDHNTPLCWEPCVFLLNARQLYSILADACKPIFVNGGPFTGDHLSWVIAKLNDIILDIDYTNKYKLSCDGTSINGYENLVDYIKYLIERDNGPAINIAYMQKNLQRMVFASEFNGDHLPVVIINTNEGDRNALNQIYHNAYKYEPNEQTPTKITQEFVITKGIIPQTQIPPTQPKTTYKKKKEQ